MYLGIFVFFFFQAEDGIRDYKVTGVQTCALPICDRSGGPDCSSGRRAARSAAGGTARSAGRRGIADPPCRRGRVAAAASRTSRRSCPPVGLGSWRARPRPGTSRRDGRRSGSRGRGRRRDRSGRDRRAGRRPRPRTRRAGPPAPPRGGAGTASRGGGRGLVFLLLALGRGPALGLRRLFLLLGAVLAFLAALDAVHQLEDDQRRVVARAPSRLDDACVAAVAVREAGGDRVEEGADHLGVRHHRQHLAPRVEALALGQRDHVLGGAAHGLGLGLGRGDPLVAEQRDQEVTEQRPAVLGEPSELVVGLAVSHRSPPAAPRPSAPRTFGSMRMPSESPSAASAVLISSMDFSPRFLTSTRSVSLFWTRSATRCMSAPLSALMARAGSASSSSVLPSASRRYASPDATSASSSSSGAPVVSGEKWSRRNVEARVSASSGPTEPSVQISTTSFS